MTNWGEFKTERGLPTKLAKGAPGYIDECIGMLAPEFKILDAALTQISLDFPEIWGARILKSVKYRLVYQEGDELNPATNSTVLRYFAKGVSNG